LGNDVALSSLGWLYSNLRRFRILPILLDWGWSTPFFSENVVWCRPKCMAVRKREAAPPLKGLL
jgi:hypothetical protein